MPRVPDGLPRDLSPFAYCSNAGTIFGLAGKRKRQKLGKVAYP